MRICVARTEAGAEAKRRSFRFGRHRRCLPSRRSALSRCAAASDEPKCLFAFTDGSKRRPPHRQPRTASYLRAPHNLLPAEQKLGRRRLRGGSVIVRFGRIENAGVCGASACAAACRSSMPRPLRKKQNASALFLTRRHKGVSLLHRIWNAAARRRPREAGVRGRSLRLCAGRCGIACRRSARRRPTAKPKRPSRFRPNPFRVSARRIGKRRGRKRRSGFRCEQKTSAARSRRCFSFTRFSSRRGRTEG